jgi:hypothetical protein
MYLKSLTVKPILLINLASQYFFQYHQTNEQSVLLRTGEWGETALQLALRLERSPEMIRALLRGKGQEAIDMNLEEYRFKDYDNEDLHCKDFFSSFIS